MEFRLDRERVDSQSTLISRPLRSQPFRVLFVFEQYGAGGFETHVDALIRKFVADGVDVHCLSGSGFSRSPVFDLVKDHGPVDFQIFTGSSVELQARRISEIIAAEHIDVVHSHPFVSFLPAALGALLASVPYGVTFHGPPDLSRWTKNFGALLVESLSRFILPCAAFITAVSQETKDSISKVFGVDADRISVCLNPIDTDEFHPSYDEGSLTERSCLLVSRLDDDKFRSCAAALELFQELQRTDASWRLSVAGSGNRVPDLKNYAFALKLANVNWLGYKPDIAELMPSSTVVVGMGRVMLEAIAAGRVAVLSGYQGLISTIRPEDFSRLQAGNFDGRSWRTKSTLSVSREVEQAIADGPEPLLRLRELLLATHHDATIAAQLLALYKTCELNSTAVKVTPFAESALRWLAQLGDQTLRVFPWTESAAEWPPILLGAESDGKLVAQSVEMLALERARMRRADEVRKLTLARLGDFEERFNEQWETYKEQRAWKIMLWVRKAYSLLADPGHLPELFRFLLLTCVGRADSSDQELKFPAVSRYVPAELSAPLDLPPHAGSYDVAGFEITPATKYDIVILAIIDFDFRFQRPQQLAAQFAAQGHRVFWVSPTRFLKPNHSQLFEIAKLRNNVWEIHLRGPELDIYGGILDPASATILSESLAEMYRQLGVVENCVIAELPFWRQLTLNLRNRFGSRILYDCMDDWDTFPDFGEFNIAEERQLATEADVLVVTAQRLKEKFEARGLQPLLARNAADFDFFFPPATPAEALQQMPKPIVGYFGAIADWMDLDLVEAVARLRPNYSFVLIGKVFGRDVSRLSRLPNVFLLGNKEYSEIPSYLEGFDVCTIPFLVNQVTNATDPVKLYEYFSKGKPVVSTAMAELSYAADLVYIAHSAEEFANKIDLALAGEADDLRNRRIQFARENTWAQRCEAQNQAISAAFPLVSILIVCFNSADFIGPCLDSILEGATYPNLEVIVLDNSSTDSSASVINFYAAKDRRVRAELLSRNLGFAAGNNHASSLARGEYLIFLNADTLVTPGWIDLFLRHSRREASIGLIVPVTNFAGNECKINVDYEDQPQMEAFSRALTRKQFGKVSEIEVAPLFCAFMPRAVWEAVGRLDERFGIGMFEDDDLSMQVRSQGWKVALAEDCFIHHFGQGSFSQLSFRAI